MATTGCKPTKIYYSLPTMKSLLTLALVTLLVSLGFAQEAKAPSDPAANNTPKAAPSKEGTVIMKTSMGEIHILLNPTDAPKTVENFLKYVDAKFYDNTVFHRVIKGFMIQGGGFKMDGKTLKRQKTKPAIKNESSASPSNARGTIAMARLGNPDSATAQFFINLVDNQALDYPAHNGGYVTFGKVIKGMEIVDKIAAVPVEAKQRMTHLPTETITITSVTRAK